MKSGMIRGLKRSRILLNVLPVYWVVDDRIFSDYRGFREFFGGGFEERSAWWDGTGEIGCESFDICTIESRGFAGDRLWGVTGERKKEIQGNGLHSAGRIRSSHITINERKTFDSSI
jgi:hypothetical protein